MVAWAPLTTQLYRRASGPCRENTNDMVKPFETPARRQVVFYHMTPREDANVLPSRVLSGGRTIYPLSRVRIRPCQMTSFIFLFGARGKGVTTTKVNVRKRRKNFCSAFCRFSSFVIIFPHSFILNAFFSAEVVVLDFVFPR